MEYAIGYVAMILVLQLFITTRNPHIDAQTLLVATLFWPFIILLVICSFALDAIGWGFDMVRNDKIVYFRKPTNPLATGFAVTLFTFEFQLFKIRKA
jgi:hypothetical protein